ncbi:YiiD C-terminal domain-containing protein [uncultured Ferrimonas sp.]|uniref:YiiD C-terminal domain-containing protein n=1 Tax=uncultured Ferrimonas sp. TaxID=432640 RepID=UPI0026365A45|nr:YiiD C-terminal domain-containing protein [uncultured Ferrimonas sp.]
MASALLTQLTQLWHDGIPLAKAMGIRADAFEDGRFTTTLPFAANQNHHQSQFAGSIYSQCTLTGWGRVWLALQAQGLDGAIVLAHGDIRYRKPVLSALPCVCTASELDLSALRAGRNAKISLTVQIGDCAEFVGDYVVMAPR